MTIAEFNMTKPNAIKLFLGSALTLALAFSGTTPAQAEGVVDTYTITYSTTGSTSGSAPSPAGFDTAPDAATAAGTVASSAGSLVKTGYDFRGWTTSANGAGTFYLPGASITLSRDITLYPAFGGTITFSANGGTGAAASATADYTLGRALTLPAVGTLARATYKFLGWRKDVALKTYQSGGSSYTVSDPATADFIMYATWGRSVTFNANGATVGSAPAAMTWVDTDVALVLKTPAQAGLFKRGFDHVGWSASAFGLVVSNSYLPTLADQVLYASWKAQPTKRTFRIDFRTNKKVLLPYSEARIANMLDLLDPEAVFPKQKVTVFLKSKRFVTQSSALGKARIKLVRTALKDAGITAKVVWSNETRSSGSRNQVANNRVIAVLQWVN